jgi:hypothetical protein
MICLCNNESCVLVRNIVFIRIHYQLLSNQGREHDHPPVLAISLMPANAAHTQIKVPGLVYMLLKIIIYLHYYVYDIYRIVYV